jgi:hypothetical protein
MMRLPSLLLGLFAGSLAAPWAQDPKPAPAPPPAKSPATAAAPANEPKTSTPRQPHALEGVYELRARMVEGRAESAASRGYLAITQRHLLLCFSAPGPTADKPLVRAGVRTWQPADTFVDGVVKLGWYTDAEGRVTTEKVGAAERRRIDAIPGGVRVWQDGRNWLDFERVE